MEVGGVRVFSLQADGPRASRWTNFVQRACCVGGAEALSKASDRQGLGCGAAVGIVERSWCWKLKGQRTR